ncbi:filamentous hemagglutinin N-terminal domain-containing protein, partial [Escherichia coli]|uniref:beta strand repeat-containing protein n=1 Tax=Escherichia coli TaxID=562 RepID=UPI001A8D8CDF|nr:filamentous hemagglutinin N-terminal domain-containing protein [Escherichia coli]
MNHIYKLKFDQRRRELVVVSEITAGVGKAKSTGSVAGNKVSRRGVRALALSLLSGMIMMAHPVTAANLPTGGQIVAGAGSIHSPSGNQMNIHQSSQNMVANWNSFDIGQGNTVQFYQPDSSAVALNRVVGGGESRIMGNLKANGQVFLVNPNGVLFGRDSGINTAGFVASTRDIKNDDFMNRRYTFSGGQKKGAEIVSQGTLTTTPGGYIVLAADRVRNSGTIRTPGGKTVLAATERVTLQLDKGGLTSVQVTGDVVNALVENRGLVSARDGQVFLTAHGRDMLMNTVLNVSGVTEAGGMHRQDGNIVLDGGDSGVVHLSGTLQADNAAGKGGKVVVQGQNLLLDKGSAITATGSHGGGEVYVGGGWQGKDGRIKNADKVVMQNGARIDVSATHQSDGGTAVLWSESFTNFRGQISAKGGEQGGNGGQVETSSHGNLQTFGSVNASAKKGKAGNWLLDPLDINIVSGNSTSVTETSDGLAMSSFTPTASGSQVSNTSINNELNNGTSVTILTSSTTAGGNQQGNITVNADITKTSGSDANLTLKADGNITINNNITSSTGKLNISLQGGGSSSARILLQNATLKSNGGDITLGRMDNAADNAMTVKVQNSTLNASSNGSTGNITINAYNPNVNLSVANYNSTVRNQGSLLSVENSSLYGGNIILTGTQNGSNSRHLPVYLTNATLNATSNITLTGNTSNSSHVAQLELRGNNTLTAQNGSINISHNMESGVSLNGTSSNLNLTADNGTITLTGGRVQMNNANLTAGQGINITGNSTGNDQHSSGVNISGNSTLKVNNGSITVTGNASGSWLYYKGIAGILMTGNISMTANNISINGSTNNGDRKSTSSTSLTKAVFFSGGTFRFTGNTSVTGKSIVGLGVGVVHNNNFTFNNGTAAINASNTGVDQGSGGYYAAFGSTAATGNNANLSITLNNTDLSISGISKKSPGVSGFFSGLLNITLSGNGNVSINGTSQDDSGVQALAVNASGLHGTATLSGTSQNVYGVRLFGGTQNNVTITGNATGNGSGVDISGNSTLTNTTVNGSGVNGSGVDISGTLTNTGNTTIGGNTTGNGTGVDINGSVSGGTVTGNASGDGNGVNVSGNVTNGTITGNATGNGSGVDISGNSTLTNTTVNGSGVNGSGVDISGTL